jgi:hypothetical protein
LAVVRRNGGARKEGACGTRPTTLRQLARACRAIRILAPFGCSPARGSLLRGRRERLALGHGRATRRHDGPCLAGARVPRSTVYPRVRPVRADEPVFAETGWYRRARRTSGISRGVRLSRVARVTPVRCAGIAAGVRGASGAAAPARSARDDRTARTRVASACSRATGAGIASAASARARSCRTGVASGRQTSCVVEIVFVGADVSGNALLIRETIAIRRAFRPASRVDAADERFRAVAVTRAAHFVFELTDASARRSLGARADPDAACAGWTVLGRGAGRVAAAESAQERRTALRVESARCRERRTELSVRRATAGCNQHQCPNREGRPHPLRREFAQIRHFPS